MKKVEAIVVAAGKGRRLGNKNKPFIKIGKIPIVIHALSALSESKFIQDIILVVEQNKIKYTKLLIKKYNLKKIKSIVAGGKRRQESVRNGLNAINDGCEFVAIHDGARPFVDTQLVDLVIKKALKTNAAILAVPAKSTLKLLKDNKAVVSSTLKRNKIWEAQTPQVFRKDILIEAYTRYKMATATDDALVVEKLGIDISVVKGSYFNIKITTPEDLIFARAIVKKLT